MKPELPGMATLWTRMAAGSHEARGALIEAHRRYVGLTVARTVPNPPAGIERDDLYAEGLVALVKAVDRFDPARGVGFRSYLIGRIGWALKEYLRQEDWAPRAARARAARGGPEPLTIVSLESGPASEAEGVWRAGIEQLRAPEPEPAAAMHAEQQARRLRAVVGVLGGRERAVLKGYYWDEESIEAIAARLGVSASLLYKAHQQALRRCRAFLLRQGFER